MSESMLEKDMKIIEMKEKKENKNKIVFSLQILMQHYTRGT